MAPVTSADGPVAVTGASGYIGAHVCKNLVEHGYTVRACVRDASRADRTQHLLAMNGRGVGSIELAEADMMVDDSYDAVFRGCTAVFHVAANFGTDPRWAAATDVVGRVSPIDGAIAELSEEELQAPTSSYDQGVYDSLVVATERVLSSIEKSGSVRRLIYTSSYAAIGGPGSYEEGHQISEADWAGAGPYISEEHMMEKHGGRWTAEDNAYGKGKTDCERLIYEWGPAHGVECISSCPSVVMGPLLSPAHDMTWQHRVGEMFAGKYATDWMWNVVDVRDTADAQRRMAESPLATNGSRYLGWSPSDGSGELTSFEVVEILHRAFPEHSEHIVLPTDCSPTAEESSEGPKCGVAGCTFSKLSEEELGLRCHNPVDTIVDTIQSMLDLDLVTVKPGQTGPTSELRDLYNVSEMDGCSEEMEFIVAELRKRVEAGDAQARL